MTLGFGERAAQTTGVRATKDPEKNPYRTPKVMTPACVDIAIHERPIAPVMNATATIVLSGPTLSARMLGNCVTGLAYFAAVPIHTYQSSQ